MIGLFWNIRGLVKIGRLPALVSRIKESHADIVGIMETKKDNFTPGYLKSLTSLAPLDWTFLPASGSAGRILVGANSDCYTLTVGDILNYSVSVSLLDKKTGFSWKLVVVCGSHMKKGNNTF